MNTSSEQLIQEAVTEARRGNKENARKITKQVVVSDTKNKRAWYVLSQLVEDRGQEEYCLRKILQIQPDNTRAKERLSQIESFQDLVISPVTSPTLRKTCPICRSAIDMEVIVCPRCARDINPIPHVWLVIFSIGCIFFGLGCLFTNMCIMVPMIIYLLSQFICK